MRLRSSESLRGQVSATPKASSIRRPIGRILNIDPREADVVAEHQTKTGRLFGETAVELGMTSETDVQRAVEEQLGFTVLAAGDQRVDPLVVAAFDPNDPLARAVRDLRGSLAGTRRADGTPLQSVALIGLDAATETSLLAANLAVACAQAGYRTLLVDANLAHPQHHGLFRVSNRTGLSTMLSTGDNADLAAQPTAIPSLSLITAGPAVPNGPELLERQRLAQSVDQLVDGFDMLIADVANADGNSLAAAFGLDGAILVVRRDVSSTRSLQEAVERIEHHGTVVIGTVLAECCDRLETPTIPLSK